MHPLVIISPVILTFFIFLVPLKIREIYAIFLTIFIAVVTTITAIPAFSGEVIITSGFQGASLTFTIDRLTALFILVTNSTAVTGVIVSGGMLKPYGKSGVQIALNYFSYSWLHLSMLGLLMFRDGVPFLIAWELMAVSSFMLILFDAEKREILKTAVNYLVQMHIGLVLLIIGLLVVWKNTGDMSFNALPQYFASHSNAGLFLLFFAGFAMKAGFIPFHTWLPDAHPAAPSHVSGFMSGVMIKMGIYGILRIVVNLQSDIYFLGIFVLIISMLTGIYGIMLSIVQKDMKRLLAYCSIENIGIIGIGIGTGMIGKGSGNELMMVLGFTGALLHVVNHSLVKSLLFFSAGSVYMRYHTRNMEEMGGVIKTMPRTALMFLAGSLAICGLPPMNSFISELLIYSGMFNGLSAVHPLQSILMLASVVALVLTGGLAVFAFVKAFGITFLGTPRKTFTGIKEAGPSVLIPQYLITALIVLIGLFPVVFIRPVLEIVTFYFPLSSGISVLPLADIFSKISLAGGIFIILIILIMIFRKVLSRKAEITTGPTWGCGYTAGTSRIQYTGTSFSGNLAGIAAPLIPQKQDYQPIQKNEIFPSGRSFFIKPVDFFKKGVFKLTDKAMWLLKYLARLQTGHIQHYVLYAFVFILIIFSLLYLNIL